MSRDGVIRLRISEKVMVNKTARDSALTRDASMPAQHQMGSK